MTGLAEAIEQVDAFVDVQVSLTDVIKFLREQEAAYDTEAEEQRNDYDHYMEARASAGTVDVMVRAIIDQFTPEGRVRLAAEQKINAARNLLENRMIAFNTRYNMPYDKAHRMAMTDVFEMDDVTVFQYLDTMGYAWIKTEWLKGQGI